MPTFRVRRGGAADVDTLVAQRVAMHVELNRPTPAELRLGARQYRRWMRDQIRKKQLVVFIAETQDGEVAAGGLVWLRESSPRPGSPYHRLPRIHSMYTRPEFRQKGAATLIVREGIRWARSHGYPRISLQTTPQARNVYARAGFREVAEMQLDLRSRRSARGSTDLHLRPPRSGQATPT
ncbi:MAG: GNAT family N-acetyltransferase [Thermoplasmata archaeon]